MTTKLQTISKTPKEMKKKIKEMARKYGFHDVEYAGKWKNCKVYEAIFTDGREHCIGFPQYIIEENGKLRWTKDWEESLAVMDALGSDEEDDEDG